MADLKADLGFIVLKNPIIPASGTFGYGEEFQSFFNLDLLGAFVLKGIYREARPGNPPPRIRETPAGLLNSIGLPGPGMKKLAETIRCLAAVTTTPIAVNVCGSSDEEFLEVACFFDRMPEVALLELNISCPNVKQGGKCPAQNEDHTFRLAKQIKESVKKPLLVKLSPNVADIASVSRAAEEGGADALAVANTFLGLAVDVEKKRTIFHNFYAGYSGPAIKPLALRLVHEAARAVQIPVIGIGGITSGLDVLEFILAGAGAVQIGTVNLIEPTAAVRIIKELEKEMDRLGIHNLEEIRGKIIS